MSFSQIADCIIPGKLCLNFFRKIYFLSKMYCSNMNVIIFSFVNLTGGCSYHGIICKTFGIPNSYLLHILREDKTKLCAETFCLFCQLNWWKCYRLGTFPQLHLITHACNIMKICLLHVTTLYVDSHTVKHPRSRCWDINTLCLNMSKNTLCLNMFDRRIKYRWCIWTLNRINFTPIRSVGGD